MAGKKRIIRKKSSIKRSGKSRGGVSSKASTRRKKKNGGSIGRGRTRLYGPGGGGSGLAGDGGTHDR
jgi:hypothetical protein